MSTDDTAAPTTTATLPLAGGHWPLDTAHSSVTFSIRHLGLSKVRGRFASFDARLEVGTSPDDTRVDATIDMGSVDTNNADRDEHLRSPDFFDVVNHPEMRFRSTRISGAGDEWSLDGELTVQGRTYPVTFDVELHGVETYPIDQSRHAGFSASGQIRRTEMGLDFGIPTAVLGDVVRFELDLQFVEPDTA